MNECEANAGLGFSEQDLTKTTFRKTFKCKS